MYSLEEQKRDYLIFVMYDRAMMKICIKYKMYLEYQEIKEHAQSSLDEAIRLHNLIVNNKESANNEAERLFEE